VYRVDTAGVGGTGPLVEGALALGAMESAESERARVRFTFQPSGAASGDTVLVRAQHGTRLVSVDPWNGTAVAHAR
jgi:hypothetical protein